VVESTEDAVECPVEVEAAREEDGEHDVVLLVLLRDDNHDTGDKDHLGDIVDAQVEPDPAAVVGGEVEGLLVADIASSLLILFSLLEGTNHSVSGESLVHVGFHWAEDGVSDSVKLVVDGQEWSDNVVAEQ